MSKRIIEPENPKLVTSTSFDGKHSLVFNEGSHRYKLNGKSVPGVTTFIHDGYPTSRNLISWMIGQGADYAYEKLIDSSTHEGNFIQWPDSDEKKDIIKESKTAHQQKSKNAADIGTFVHDIAYLTELGKTEERNKKVLEAVNHPDGAKIISAVEKFDAWKESNKDEIVASEQVVASVIHNFCGKFDRLVMRDGKLILSDFKTSSGIYPEMFLQLAAYRIAIREWLGKFVEGLEILRFGKEEGEFQTLLIDNLDEILMFEEQTIRCRETYNFRKIESDERFQYGGKK